MDELPIVQKARDLIKWYVPLLNRLPRDHKFMLGDRLIANLYELHEGLIRARYDKAQRIERLEHLNGTLDVLRHRTRPLLDFNLISAKRYQHAAKLINEVGVELGGWLKQQRRRK